MEYLLKNIRNVFTLSEFMEKEIVVDPEVAGRCRIVLAKGLFGEDIILEGFSHCPSGSNRDIRRAAFFYYIILRGILLKQQQESRSCPFT